MNKKLWMATFLIVAMFVMAGCNNPFAGETVEVHIGASQGSFQVENNKLTLKEGAVVCFSEESKLGDLTLNKGQAIKAETDFTVNATGNTGEFEILSACPIEQVGSSVKTASDPAATPEPTVQTASGSEPAAPASGAGQCMTAAELRAFAPTWEEIVYPLDHGVPGKVHHPTGPWMAHAGEVIWLGVDWSPQDITLGGKLEPIQVDGWTGIYYVLSDVEIKGPGASNACISSIQKQEIKAEVGGQCVNTDTFVAVINLYRSQGPALINRLDEIIDTNAQYQIRSLGGGTFPSAAPATRILWTNDTVPVPTGMALHSAGGMTVYVLPDASDVNVEGQTWRGICLTRALDPETDFVDWWGK